MLGRCFLLLALLGAALSVFGQTISVSTSEFASKYAAWRAEETAHPGDLTKDIESKFPATFESRAGVVYEEAKVGKERIKGLYWRSIDAIVFSAGSLDRLKDFAASLDRPVGGHFEAGPSFLAIASAIEKSKAVIDTKPMEALKAEWEAKYAAKGQEAMDWMAGLVGLEKRPKKIQIVLVPKIASKEGMTIQTMAGPSVILAAESLKGSDLAEVVLHESLHVLDTANTESSFFVAVRKALTEAKRPGEEIEQLPHTLMFVLASEAVRKFYDPAHVDYGQSHGTYARGLDKYLKAAKAGYKALPDQVAAKAAIVAG